MDPSPHLWFLHAKQRLWTRITNLYGSQTSPVILCMQYSVISTRITCLYGSQPLSMVFGCTTATFGSKLLVSMGPSHNLSFLCMQNSVISTCITSLYRSQPSSVVFACKTATFGPEYKSLWVPDLTCRFVHAKQRDLHQNDKFTLVPTLICVFVHVKQRL